MANKRKSSKGVDANWKALNANVGKGNASNWKKNNVNLTAFLSDNKRILMPAILVIAVIITVVVAINANRRAASKLQESTEGNTSTYEIPDVTMEENAYPEVNALVEKYYRASADGDRDTIVEIYKGLDDTEILKAIAASDYIENYENITVYTKPGPVEGSYVAYVYNEVKLKDYDGSVPGLETLYICTDDSGNLYINGDIADENELDYIKQINLQADVIDLNNKVASSYNELVSGDEKLAEVLTNMRSGLQVSVGEALATNEAAALVSANSTADDGGMETVVVSRVIRATDVINIRKSDSETAEVLGKTEKGQEFNEQERLANGWSKIEYNGSSAYVKTEFFDTVSEETREVPKSASSAEGGNSDGASQDTAAAAASESSQDSSAAASSEASVSDASASASSAASSESSSSKTKVTKTGKLRTTESVKLRKGQGTDTEALETIYQGETVNVIEHLSNGWSKVEYNKKTGYVKTEFLEE
ncbi:MAG: SH3 domain-containing protein [Butyrivibrio sp.]|nr:SH3 domain-containing protein [Butyrivibrio sp.]